MAPTFLLKNLPTRKELKFLSGKYRSIDVSAAETYMTLLGLADDILLATDSHMARHGISQGRMRVLSQLLRSPGTALSPCALAEKIGVSRATVTGLLDGLERKGLVRRERSPQDRRSVRIRLLPEGRRLLDRLLPDRFRCIAKLMAPLSERQRGELRRLLMKVSFGLPAYREG